MSDAQIHTMHQMANTDGWHVERVGRFVNVVCDGTGTRFRIRCDGSLTRL